MSDLKLGKLPAVRPFGLRSLAVYASGRIPDPPASVPVPPAGYPIDGNDQYGCCVIEGTLVEGLSTPLGAVRVAYSGPVVRLEVVGGQSLTVTPNHAVLTNRGFRLARDLREGDNLICASLGGEAVRGTQHYLEESQTRVEDVFAALRVIGRARKKVALPDDLHGDGRFAQGDIDVVWSDGALEDEWNAEPSQMQRKEEFGDGDITEALLGGPRAPLHALHRGGAPTLGLVGRRDLRGPLLGVHSRPPQARGHRDRATSYASPINGARKRPAIHSEFQAQCPQILPGGVAPHGFGQVAVDAAPPRLVPLGSMSQLCASILQPTRQGHPTDPELPGNLIKGLPGLVRTERLVHVKSEHWDGHVYDLQTNEHWYGANGIVTHNCVAAGMAHLIAAWDAEVGRPGPIPDAQEVLDTYFQLTGGQDTGLNEASVLSLWRSSELFGERIAAYAPVDHGNLLDLHQAIAFYGGAMLGIQCPQSAQEQFASGQPWTVVPGSPVVGGHCLIALGYTPQGLLCATWGGIAEVTYPFAAKFLDEAYAVIPNQFVEAGKGPRLDLASLEADLDSLA